MSTKLTGSEMGYSDNTNRFSNNQAMGISGKTGAPAMASVIRKDIRVVGDVICSGDVQLDGIVEGNLQSRGATISEGAHVHGSVSAENVRILGSVTGQVRGNNVMLAKTAKVIGDILHQSLAIEPGAFLDGQCRPINGTTNTVDVKPVNLRDKPVNTQQPLIPGQIGAASTPNSPIMGGVSHKSGRNN